MVVLARENTAAIKSENNYSIFFFFFFARPSAILFVSLVQHYTAKARVIKSCISAVEKRYCTMPRQDSRMHTNTNTDE